MIRFSTQKLNPEAQRIFFQNSWFWNYEIRRRHLTFSRKDPTNLGLPKIEHSYRTGNHFHRGVFEEQE